MFSYYRPYVILQFPCKTKIWQHYGISHKTWRLYTAIFNLPFNDRISRPKHVAFNKTTQLYQTVYLILFSIFGYDLSLRLRDCSMFN